MAVLSYKDFPDFIKVLNLARERSLYSADKNFMLWQLVKLAQCCEGNLAEVGTYKGGTACVILSACSVKKKVFLFDTFSGIPYADERDLHKKGDFSDTSLVDVQNFLHSFSFTNFKLVEGIFPASAIQLELSKIAFVHVDVDVYQSTSDCLDFFYPRLSSGGIILLDDYGTLSCPGTKQAVDEFLSTLQNHTLSTPEGNKVGFCNVLSRLGKQLLYLETGQAIIFK